MYDYAGNADRSMGYWDPERKLGVARLFFFFFRDNYTTIILKSSKIQGNVWRFFFPKLKLFYL